MEDSSISPLKKYSKNNNKEDNYSYSSIFIKNDN